MKNLKKVDGALVDIYFKKFKEDKRYFVADEAMEKLYNVFPGNSDLKNILLKLSVLNDLYSTNIYATFKMAEHIYILEIDPLLKKGDPSVVHRIAKVNFIDRNFYSFATKYCHWHNTEEYPIYDKFVDGALWEYQNKDSFSNFKRKDMKDFVKFKSILEDFKKFYNLEKYSLRKIDKFLWIYGKELF